MEVARPPAPRPCSCPNTAGVVPGAPPHGARAPLSCRCAQCMLVTRYFHKTGRFLQVPCSYWRGCLVLGFTGQRRSQDAGCCERLLALILVTSRLGGLRLPPTEGPLESLCPFVPIRWRSSSRALPAPCQRPRSWCVSSSVWADWPVGEGGPGSRCVYLFSTEVRKWPSRGRRVGHLTAFLLF